MSNRLIREQSPYLLQHAHNPVDWYPWGPEALTRAKKEDKPILLSIGYSACHWCHVMERESFEDPEVAAIMNEHFVNIKVDREERPDLDHIYMDAVQSITGSGGWPLHAFLTPEGRPFYGGTYFPPVRAHHRPAWRDVLLAISSSYRERKDEILAQSDYLVSHLLRLNQFASPSGSSGEDIFTRETLDRIREQLMKVADRQEGGFGRAPKFPQTFTIQYLLRDYYYSGQAFSLDQACLSLDKMILGGLYDQAGGGFARYSTDAEWLVPHFEKMLYDNALLVTVMSEAFQLTGKDLYKQTVADTLNFLERELGAPEGGFYAALDADSEGEEGRYYVWDKAEVDQVLGADSELFCRIYNITEKGNWEGRNILHLRRSPEELAAAEGMDPRRISEFLRDCRGRLLAVREQRIRPRLDNKVILGWNALLVCAYAKAYAAFGIEAFRESALRLFEFLWDRFRGEGICRLHHVYSGGEARLPAFLDDYAGMIQAMIQLQEITGEAKYLLNARALTEWVLEHFSGEGGDFFYYTHKDQEDLVIRKKEIYDGAQPSGNSVMSINLSYLSIIFDLPSWRDLARKQTRALAEMIINHPGSFSVWATRFQALTYGMEEVVMMGKNPQALRKEFLRHFIPFRVFQTANTQNNQFPLLRGKACLEKTQLFLCRDYSCQVPVTEMAELVPLLEASRPH